MNYKPQQTKDYQLDAIVQKTQQNGYAHFKPC